jgi:hypothetical protein
MQEISNQIDQSGCGFVIIEHHLQQLPNLKWFYRIINLPLPIIVPCSLTQKK